MQTKLKDNFKWFGQIFLSGALAESVTATVEAKEGKIQAVCLEIGQIVNDWRSQVVGGIKTSTMGGLLRAKPPSWRTTLDGDQ